MITNFTTIRFILFALVVISLMQLARSKRGRSTLLAASGTAFLYLAVLDLRSFGAILAYLTLSWIGMRCLAGFKNAQQILIPAMVLAYMCLKKYSFLEDVPFVSRLTDHGLVTLGVSFMIFRQISWSLKVRTGNLIDYLAYNLNFTTLLAGPVQEPDDFLRNVDDGVGRLTTNDILSHLSRLTNGLVKKYVLCDFLVVHALPDPAAIGGMTGLEWLVQANVFLVYLYLDFSGYCDIVISLAGLCGLNIPENFNKPWLSSNIIQFWSRWHMSVSGWIRNYLYTPLTKSLTEWMGVARLHICSSIAIFIAFFVMGMWHGTTQSYLIFGLLQGTGILACHIYQHVLLTRLGRQRVKTYESSWVRMAVGRIVTLQFMALSVSLMYLEPDDFFTLARRLAFFE